MEIKKPKRRNSGFLGRKKVILAALLMITSYTTLCIIGGVYAGRSLTLQGVRKEYIIRSIKSPFNYVSKLVKGFASNPERIYIDIKFENYQKLAYQRKLALSKNYLMVSDNDYVPASIRYRDQTFKVKLRLKGDHVDHLQGDKWSFRIKVRGNHTLFGMKQFSIHHPRTRNFLSEWIYHQALKKEGVLSLRYDFINVTVNGKNLGIYAIEEHFEKRLVEHNDLREGPIVRFDETFLWKEFEQVKQFKADVVPKLRYWQASSIDTFQTSKYLSDPELRIIYSKAISLLESFRRGILLTSQVFDVQKLARYFAISDLLGAEHGARWHNVRFYYNPITSRLEPIGFDSDALTNLQIGALIGEGIRTGMDARLKDDYYFMVFQDQKFFEEYVNALEKVSSKKYIEELLGDLTEEFEKRLRIIYKEFPSYAFNRDILYNNQKYIRSVINPLKGIHAYFNAIAGNRVTLDIGNLHSLPLDILGISTDKGQLFLPEKRLVAPPRNINGAVKYLPARFVLPDDFPLLEDMKSGLTVRYKVLGSSIIKQEPVFPWRFLPDDFVENDFMRRVGNVEEFEFLIRDEDAKEILIRPGEWTLTSDLIIPKGYRVIASSGTVLKLTRSATILSYSPLSFVGTEENPIRITSDGSSGQGLFVTNAHMPSLLEHVAFENLSNPSKRGWALTGAVTFYESPVEIRNCKFLNNRSEDGLNIVRSSYSIKRSLFEGTFSDAFDADFSDGEITNSSFVKSGNDAIDVSGSRLDLEGIFIGEAGDKGISIGENSRAIGRQVVIDNAYIAIACKDMSEMQMVGLEISNSRFGFSAYQKKPEYGAGHIVANNVKKSQKGVLHLIEENSTLIIDGARIEGAEKNVYRMLYGDDK